MSSLQQPQGKITGLRRLQMRDGQPGTIPAELANRRERDQLHALPVLPQRPIPGFKLTSNGDRSASMAAPRTARDLLQLLWPGRR